MYTYPVILKLSEDGPIVKFISRNEGTVVVGNDQYQKGFHSKTWISSEDRIMWNEI